MDTKPTQVPHFWENGRIDSTSFLGYLGGLFLSFGLPQVISAILVMVVLNGDFTKIEILHEEIGYIPSTLLLVSPFILGFGILVAYFKGVHRQPIIRLFSGASSFRWTLFFKAAAILLCIQVVSISIALKAGNETCTMQQVGSFLAFLPIALVLFFFQTGFEELLFRSYLPQAFTKLIPALWFPLLMQAIIFGALHLGNNEVNAFGVGPMFLIYSLTGLIIGLMAVLTNGLEVAWGFHWINNIWVAAFFNFQDSAIKTPSLFFCESPSPEYMVWGSLIGLFITFSIFTLVFKWKNFKQLFTTKSEIS